MHPGLPLHSQARADTPTHTHTRTHSQTHTHTHTHARTGTLRRQKSRRHKCSGTGWYVISSIPCTSFCERACVRVCVSVCVCVTEWYVIRFLLYPLHLSLGSSTRASQSQICHTVKNPVCCRRRLLHTAHLTVILTLTLPCGVTGIL